VRSKEEARKRERGNRGQTKEQEGPGLNSTNEARFPFSKN